MSVISNCELTCDPNVRLCIDFDLLCSENDRLSGSSMSSRISLRALSVARRDTAYTGGRGSQKYLGVEGVEGDLLLEPM